MKLFVFMSERMMNEKDVKEPITKRNGWAAADCTGPKMSILCP